MNIFEELYKKDQCYIKKWAKDYNRRDFLRKNHSLIKELEKAIKSKRKLSSKEKFICAMIYHHGFELRCSKKAMKYVKEAQAEGYHRQRWLIASITDRLLQLQGKPQKYGTQVVKIKKGKMKQYKLDNSVSDKERIKLGLPKLKDLKKSLEG